MRKTAYKIIFRNATEGGIGNLQAAAVGLMRGCIDESDAETEKRIKALVEAYEEVKDKVLYGKEYQDG